MTTIIHNEGEKEENTTDFHRFYTYFSALFLNIDLNSFMKESQET